MLGREGVRFRDASEDPLYGLANFFERVSFCRLMVVMSNEEPVANVMSEVEIAENSR